MPWMITGDTSVLYYATDLLFKTGTDITENNEVNLKSSMTERINHGHVTDPKQSAQLDQSSGIFVCKTSWNENILIIHSK